MRVVAPDFLAIRFRRNNSRGIHRADSLEEAGCIERLVCDDSADVLHSLDQILGLGHVMPLAARQSKPGQITQRIDGSMNLGAQAPTRTAKTLLPVFFDAPAACWCARTIVLSRNTSSKSASSHSAAKMVCQTPLSAQREKRLNTLFHGPKVGGKSRHGAPVLAIQSTASTNSRLSAPVRPRSPSFPWSNGSIRTHWSSRNSNLGIPSFAQKTGCKHNQGDVNSPLALNVHTL